MKQFLFLFSVLPEVVPMREALQQEPILVKSPHAPSRDCLSFAWPQSVPSLYLAVVESYRGQAVKSHLGPFLMSPKCVQPHRKPSLHPTCVKPHCGTLLGGLDFVDKNACGVWVWQVIASSWLLNLAGTSHGLLWCDAIRGWPSLRTVEKENKPWEQNQWRAPDT